MIIVGVGRCGIRGGWCCSTFGDAVDDQLAAIAINNAADTGLAVTACSGQRAGIGSLSMAVQLNSYIQKDSVRCCQRMSVSEDGVDHAC